LGAKGETLFNLWKCDVNFRELLNCRSRKKNILDRQQIASQWGLELIFNNLHNPPPTQYFDIIINPLIWCVLYYRRHHTFDVKSCFQQNRYVFDVIVTSWALFVFCILYNQSLGAYEKKTILDEVVFILFLSYICIQLLRADIPSFFLKFCYQIENWQGGNELLLIIMCIRSQYSQMS
jgi:hypothetical protein